MTASRLPELIKTGQSIGLYADSHISHYGYWTILVVFDSVNLTWGAQARWGFYETLEEYVAAANQRPEPEFLRPDAWHVSMRRALQEIVTKIDRVA